MGDINVVREKICTGRNKRVYGKHIKGVDNRNEI
jgi:hypothetical protein